MHFCKGGVQLSISKSLLLASLASSAWAAQVPLQAVNPAASRISSEYGVGFDLTACYGTAAISFSNGTVRSIALLSGDEGYNETFRRLSLESSQHLAPPYQHLFDSWNDAPREAKRRLRKAAGLPASMDVDHLGRMLERLRDEVMAQTSLEVTSAAVITPSLVALYEEDLLDAFEYLGLDFVTLDQPRPLDYLYETSAAYAGYGFGLCTNYQDQVDCRQEEGQMNLTNILSILFTDDVLTVDLDVVASAYYIYFPRTINASDFDDGFQAGDSRDGRTAKYWDHVERRISEALESWRGDELSKVVLMGNRAGEEELHRRLDRALLTRGGHRPEVLHAEADFIAARGVAEMAKRQPYRASL